MYLRSSLAVTASHLFLYSSYPLLLPDFPALPAVNLHTHTPRERERERERERGLHADDTRAIGGEARRISLRVLDEHTELLLVPEHALKHLLLGHL